MTSGPWGTVSGESVVAREEGDSPSLPGNVAGAECCVDPTAAIPIQRKIGFELEIPVTFLTDAGENVDTKMAYLENEKFKVEGDKSSAAGTMKGMVDSREVEYSPTILEIVTKPIDEHAEDAQERLEAIILGVEGFRFGLFLETNGYAEQTTLGKLADEDLRLNSGAASEYQVNAPTATPRT